MEFVLFNSKSVDLGALKIVNLKFRWIRITNDNYMIKKKKKMYCSCEAWYNYFSSFDLGMCTYKAEREN